jgi:hypothetical protein
MVEIILGTFAAAFLGYFVYKMVVKHETPLEAITEIKDEIAYEAKHIEVVVEHKIEDALHSLEDQVSARAKVAEQEELILAAKFKHDEQTAKKDKA